MMAKIFLPMTTPVWTRRVIHMVKEETPSLVREPTLRMAMLMLGKQHGIPIYNERVKTTGVSGSSPVRHWLQQLGDAHVPPFWTENTYRLANMNNVQANLPISGIDSVSTVL